MGEIMIDFKSIYGKEIVMIVIGVGFYGIFLVIFLVCNGVNVVFWGYEVEYMVCFEVDCVNYEFLFNIDFLLLLIIEFDL